MKFDRDITEEDLSKTIDQTQKDQIKGTENTNQNADQNTNQNTNQNADQNTNQNADQNTNQNADQNTNQNTDQNTNQDNTKDYTKLKDDIKKWFDHTIYQNIKKNLDFEKNKNDLAKNIEENPIQNKEGIKKIVTIISNIGDAKQMATLRDTLINLGLGNKEDFGTF